MLIVMKSRECKAACICLIPTAPLPFTQAGSSTANLSTHVQPVLTSGALDQGSATLGTPAKGATRRDYFVAPEFTGKKYG